MILTPISQNHTFFKTTLYRFYQYNNVLMDENQPGWPPPGIIIPGATMLPGGISGVAIATWGGIPLWVGIAGAGCMGTCGGRLTGCWGIVPCPGMFMGTAPGWGIIANPGGGGGTPGCMGGCGGATCMGGTRMICKKIKPVLLVKSETFQDWKQKWYTCFQIL